MCHSVLDTESHHYLSCEMLKQVQHDTDDKTKTWCNLSDNRYIFLYLVEEDCCYATFFHCYPFLKEID